MRLAFRVAYLGDGFYGSQVQADRRTVEGEFIAAAMRLALFGDWRDCWCTGIAEAPDAFHPRYDARSRTYRYFFPKAPLDLGTMAGAARLFIGRHDFSRLARVEGRDPTRNILSARVFDDGGLPCFEVTAESFLWQMVRGMAGTLLAAGQGELDEEGIQDLLDSTAGERFPPAPSSGLVLWEVDCGIRFEPVARSPRTGAFLSTVRGHHEVMGRITAILGEG